MSNPTPSSLLRLRRRLVPDARGHGWLPFGLLLYLGFLFVPLLFFPWRPQQLLGMPLSPPLVIGLSLLSMALFLPLHFAHFRHGGRVAPWVAAGCVLLALALQPVNPFANTYIIYALSYLPAWRLPLRRQLLAAAAIVLLYAGWVVWIGQPLFLVAITTLVGVAVFFATHFHEQSERRRAELSLSHEEVRRIAAYAERERIGRDLHDLLGHTLSLIALKSELAGKLAHRDSDGAKLQIEEVARISRQTLDDMRTAVTGIRSAAFAAELASARLLLETQGIACDAQIETVALDADGESALALALREAATNIQRHARAQHVEVSLRRDAQHAVLRVRDDGRGGYIRPGTGLTGMRERLEALGGALRIDADPREGTCVQAMVPLAGGTR